MSTEVIVYGSNPQHVPTAEFREEVRKLVACGLNECDIAYISGLSPAEVMFWYREELENGLRITTAQVGGALLKNAISRGDVMAQQFWLRNKAGWNPPTKVEMKGKLDVEVTERQKVIDRILVMTQGTIDPRKNDVNTQKAVNQ